MAQADTDSTSGNVRPFPGGGSEPPPHSRRRSKDPTNATRQRRHRDKRKTKQTVTATVPATPPAELSANFGEKESSNEFKATVTVNDAPPLAPDTAAQQPGHRHGRGIRVAALIAALGLAMVSGGFSITGMTSIFVGAFWPIIGMGIALEAGKLSAVAWLGHQRGTASWRLRTALAVLAAVLMGLNAVGCYGFLAKAHIGHEVEGETAVAAHAADIEARISLQAATVADYDRRIGR